MQDKKEIFGARHPSENMKCKTCIYANGKPPFADGWRKSSCVVYQDPDIKPNDVYFDGAECEYYKENRE